MSPVNIVYNSYIVLDDKVAVKDGDTLSLGSRTLQFIAAPMVHWSEVIMTWWPEEKNLFSADAILSYGRE